MNHPINQSSPRVAPGATWEHSLRMGELRVIKSSGMIRTLLGSCVGLSLYDSSQRIAGLAHIVLPNSDGKTDLHGRYIDTAVTELIRQMNRHADRPLSLLAQIAGGARMFADSRDPTVGDLNVQAAKDELNRLAIPFVERECGGTAGRRMTIHVATGLVEVQPLTNSKAIRVIAEREAAELCSGVRD